PRRVRDQMPLEELRPGVGVGGARPRGVADPHRAGTPRAERAGATGPAELERLPAAEPRWLADRDPGKPHRIITSVLITNGGTSPRGAVRTARGIRSEVEHVPAHR